MKELTRTYSDLLQDKRVRAEQSKYEAFSRQRNSVMTKYRKVYHAFNDLIAGLQRAQGFYSEMKDTVESLQKNVETFVNNRRSEGGQLLTAIENSKKASGNAQADLEHERLQRLMERMSTDPSSSPTSPQRIKQEARPPPLQQQQRESYQPAYNTAASPPVTPRYPISNQYSMQSLPQAYPHQAPTNGSFQQFSPPPRQRESYATSSSQPYNPNTYGPVSPPATQQYFSPPPGQYHTAQQQQQPQHHSQHFSSIPPGYVPPPPPPGPPPGQLDFSGLTAGAYPAGPGGYAQNARHGRGSSQYQQGGQQGQGDPWAGLSGWK